MHPGIKALVPRGQYSSNCTSLQLLYTAALSFSCLSDTYSSSCSKAHAPKQRQNDKHHNDEHAQEERQSLVIGSGRPAGAHKCRLLIML